MKKIAVALIILYCFFVNTFAQAIVLEYDGGTHEYTGDVYTLVVNGKTLTDLPLNPIIFNDRAVVPVREVFEALGATVTYNGNNNTVKVKYGKNTVDLTIGLHTAKVNGIRKSIPDGVGVKLIGKPGEYAKTMVPVRFISENIGLVVDYDGTNKTISISEKSTRPSANPTATPKPTRTPTPVKTASPSKKPVDDDEDVSSKLTKLRYDVEDDVVTIKINADSKIQSISEAKLTSAGVVYADIYGAESELDSRTEIYEGVVEAVRVGQHEGYTRIAIDTHGVKKYSVALSSTRKSVTFKISGDKNAEWETPTPSATTTPKPTVTSKPTVAPTPTPSPTPKAIKYDKRKIVVLDAGHGGSDPGAVGYLMTEEELEAYFEALESTEEILPTMTPGSGERWNEKDLALTVTKKVRDILEENGVEVIMTRSKDTYPTLESRPALANEKGAVLFVSIHLNSTVSAVSAATGVEVFYSTQNNDNELGVTSKQLASKILEGIIDVTNAVKRGVKSGNLLVNRKCLMPSALVELGFMNNPVELELLIDEEYQDKLAEGIAQGILSVYEEVEIPKNKVK